MSRRTTGWLLLAFVVPWLGACATTPGGSAGGFRRTTFEGDPWELPASAFPSQRLYRVKYRGEEGKAGFKLTLYLGSPSHYRMVAVDSLGRKLWSLEVDDRARAVWLDHRRKEYCQAEGASRLVVVPLARLPLVSLPKLLLGRIPGVPVAFLERGRDHVSYLDVRGQKWTGVFAAGELAWWNLEDSGELVAWWRRDDDGGSDFSDVRGHQGVSFREIVRERLADPLGTLEIPEKFREGDCDGTV